MDEELNSAAGVPYRYSGPLELREPIEEALRQVVDPEVVLNIVDVGLVYAVTVADNQVQVLMTMTSAACPVTDIVLADAETELGRVVPTDFGIQVELVWEPPWTPDRMSPRAKDFMGW